MIFGIALFLLVCSCMAAIFGIAFSVIHKLCYGRMPRPLFRIFCSWWWPFRPEADAGVLIADAIFSLPDDFKVESWDNSRITGTLKNRSIKVNMRDSNEGYAELRVGDVANIPISAWGDFKLNQARRMLARAKSNTDTNRMTNENRQRYVEGTKLAAQLVTEALIEAKPEFIVDRREEFETQAKYLTARKVDNTFSNMLK